MSDQNLLYSYDEKNVNYSLYRKQDPFIAGLIFDALGDCKTVINVGAGTGSYEPVDRCVVAVEPSAKMRSLRKFPNVPAVNAYAEALPFDDKSFDAAMAILTVHHWQNIKKGLNELKRVARKKIIIMTFDPDEVHKFWLADYIPQMVTSDKARLPKIDFLVKSLGGKCEDNIVPIPANCTDGFNEAYYARPGKFLKNEVRRSQSFWDYMDKETELKAVEKLKEDIDSGKWNRKYGYLLKQEFYEGAIRLIICNIKNSIVTL